MLQHGASAPSDEKREQPAGMSAVRWTCGPRDFASVEGLLAAGHVENDIVVFGIVFELRFGREATGGRGALMSNRARIYQPARLPISSRLGVGQLMARLPTLICACTVRGCPRVSRVLRTTFSGTGRGQARPRWRM